MKKIIFCAGEIGRRAAMLYKTQGIKIDYFVDNSIEMQKKGDVFGIPVISIDELKEIPDEYSLEIACGDDIYEEIATQLSDAGIFAYERYDRKNFFRKERITSYSYKSNCEDIILWHVFKDKEEIFYIDVGCNDPVSASVTKFIYDKGGHGINIDMVPDMIDFMNIDRKRDVNICAALGEKSGGVVHYYNQDFLNERTTLVEKNVFEDLGKSEAKLTTLKDICDEHIPNGKKISFLKIDVEGYEKQVLLGADFKKYRPAVVVIEAVGPINGEPTHREWEYILAESNYEYVYTKGANRWYLAKEREDLRSKFIPFPELAAHYCIFYAEYGYYV